MPKVRADVLLYQQGLAVTREKARALILAGVVYVDEQRVDKAGQRLATTTLLQVRGQDHPYVSRGGVKLEGALDQFGYDPAGKVVADFGASTGGFTDCMLQRGAVKVVAIDVGYGQLAYRLRADSRVVVMERTNARYVDQHTMQQAGVKNGVDVVVIDASFIGLEKLLPAAVAVLRGSDGDDVGDGGDILAMVKPQFQVGRARVGKGGVVRDPALRLEAIEMVVRCAAALGLVEKGRADAPIKGPKGNHEAFLWLSTNIDSSVAL